VDHLPARRHLLVVSVQDQDSGTPLQELPPVEEPAEDSLGNRPRRAPQAPPTRGRDRTSTAELLADERCSQAVLEFLATTDVGRTSGPPVADEDEDAACEASEWEAREHAERAWERREEERLGRIGDVEMVSFSVFP